MRPIFRKEVVGDLVFYPSEGPPTSGTVTLKQADGTIFRADEAATAPAATSTLSVGVAAGVRRIAVADASLFERGMPAWVGSGADARDSFVIEEVDSALNVLVSRRPLRFAHAEDAEVSSGELTITLEAAEVASEEENRTAWWTYVVDGDTYYFEQVWDVVLRQFRLVMPEHRLKRYVASGLLDQSEQTVPELLDQAQTQIEKLLRYHGIPPTAVVDVDEFERAGGLMVRQILLDEEVQTSMQRAAVYRQAVRAFTDEWTLLIKGRVRWLDRDFDGAVSEPELAVETDHDVGFPDFSG